MERKRFFKYKRNPTVTKCISFLTVAVLVIFIFFIYFYNTFVNFQISYAKIYNENTISKLKEFNNDVIKLSSALCTDFQTRNFLNSDETGLFKKETERINEKKATSVIGDYVYNILICNHSNDTIYSLNDAKKYKREDFLKQEPLYENITKKNGYGLSTEFFYNTSSANPDKYESYLASTYNTNAGYTVSLFINYNYFETNFFQKSYPIFYGTIIADGKDSVLMSDNNPEMEKIAGNLNNSNDFSKLFGKYIITKSSSGIISCISAVKVTDLLKEALSTSSFLMIIAFILAIIIGIISYYFYFKQHTLTEKMNKLKNHNTETSLDLIIQKVFNSDILTKNDEALANSYFLLNEGNHLMPLVFGISDRSIDSEYLKQKDINLYKYGFSNIITEILEEIASVKTQSIAKKDVAFLLYNSTPIKSEEIKNKLIYCTEFIKQNFNVEIYTTMGYC